MRVAVVGAGGLGGLIAGYLARGGEDVTLIARGRNLNALRQNGLTIQPMAGPSFQVEVRATDDPASVGPVDLIWLCVKAYDLPAAVEQIGPLLNAETMIFPVQNGVEAAERVASVVGERHVVSCVSLAGGTLTEPGVVVQKLPRMQFKVGQPVGEDGRSRISNVRDTLTSAGIEIDLSDDIECELWEKLIVTSVTLGFTALCRLTVGPLFGSPSTAKLARGLMEEVHAVGRARNVRLSNDAVDRLFGWVAAVAAQNPTASGSMYFDVLAGKPLELDTVTGAVVRLGREVNVPTPYNFVVYAGLEPVAGGAAV